MRCLDHQWVYLVSKMQNVFARTAALRVGGRITVGPCSRKNFRAFATNELTITTPDDMHLHVRDGPGLRSVVPHTAQVFRRAIIMPNLVPPITTTELAMSYKKRIMEGVPQGNTFEPLMVLYLTGVYVLFRFFFRVLVFFLSIVISLIPSLLLLST